MPLVATHKNFAPFIGVVLAGEFTEGALIQLKSLDFNVLYFSYDMMVKGFGKFGIDASSEENTPEKDFQTKIRTWSKFTDRPKLVRHILRLNAKEVKKFFANLEKVVSRYITSVAITPLHGESSTMRSVERAIEFIKSYKEINGTLPILKYEILIKYNNGDKVEGAFKDNEAAIEFLGSYEAPKPKKN